MEEYLDPIVNLIFIVSITWGLEQANNNLAEIRLLKVYA